MSTYDVKTSVEYEMLKSQLASVIGDVENRFFMSSTTKPGKVTLEQIVGPVRTAADRLLKEYTTALQKLVDEREAVATTAA